MFNASIFFITLNNDNKGSPQLGLPPHTHAQLHTSLNPGHCTETTL